MVEGSPSAYAAALGDARHACRELTASFDGRPGVVCFGEVTDSDAASKAVLAAVAGAGLIVRVTASRDVADRLLDDLRRLGPVDHRLGEPNRTRLTAEQRALLDLLADGATLGAAAERLSLSRRTADRRLASARRALGVETTAEALVSYAGAR